MEIQTTIDALCPNCQRHDPSPMKYSFLEYEMKIECQSCKWTTIIRYADLPTHFQFYKGVWLWREQIPNVSDTPNTAASVPDLAKFTTNNPEDANWGVYQPSEKCAQEISDNPSIGNSFINTTVLKGTR